MTSPCWSQPHLLSSSPQHEAPPGQHDLFQDDTVHREPLPQTTRSESNAKEPLSHINYESGRNLRTNTPTGLRAQRACDPRACDQGACDNFWKFSGRPLSIIRCTEREFGEQDQHAPFIEDVKEFVQIETRGLLDHGIAEMSPVDQMTHLQSQMRFDESMESMADSDLEDGELQKLLTSPLYVPRASGKPDAMVVQEREVSAQTSHSSEDHGAPGNRLHCFHQIVLNRETKCGVVEFEWNSTRRQ